MSYLEIDSVNIKSAIALALMFGPKASAVAPEVAISVAIGRSEVSQPGNKGRCRWKAAMTDPKSVYDEPRFRNLVVNRAWLAVPRDHHRSRNGNRR